jgi:hypothetical protein
VLTHWRFPIHERRVHLRYIESQFTSWPATQLYACLSCLNCAAAAESAAQVRRVGDRRERAHDRGNVWSLRCCYATRDRMLCWFHFWRASSSCRLNLILARDACSVPLTGDEVVRCRGEADEPAQQRHRSAFHAPGLRGCAPCLVSLRCCCCPAPSRHCECLCRWDSVLASALVALP